MPTGMLQAAGPSPAAGGSLGELVALLMCGAHSEGQLCTRPSSLPPDCVSHRHVPVFIFTIFSSVFFLLCFPGRKQHTNTGGKMEKAAIQFALEIPINAFQLRNNCTTYTVEW